MLSILKDIYLIVRPSGLKRLLAVLTITLLQAVVQTVAVFSLIPFLSAVTDIDGFRRSPMGRIFIQVIGDGSNDRLLIHAGLASLTTLIVGNVLTVLSDHLRARYSFSIAQDLRTSLTNQLLGRRYAYFLGVNSSSLIKILVDDVGKVAAELVLPALDLASRILIVVLMATSVLFIEPLVVVIGLAVILAYSFVVMRPIRRKAQATSGAIMDGFRTLHFEIFQTLNGVKQILASGRKEYFVARISDASRNITREMVRIPMYAAIPRSGLELLVFGGMIVWVLTAIISGGNLTGLIPRIGFMAVVAYRTMPSLQLIFAQAAMMSSARQALDEVKGLMGEQEHFAAPATPQLEHARNGSPAGKLEWSRHIRFVNVSFSYDALSEPAVKDLNFTIEKGARVAFVGPTGSGKSTLMDLLIGLLSPSSGQILIDDRPLTSDDMSLWRRTIGYVPQDLFLLDGSIAENVAFGCDPATLDRARVLEVAEIAQAREFIEAGQPQGIDAIVGERGVRLSGGQRQRLALARALYFSPNLLILDEATSALDPVTERKVTRALASNGDKVTVVTVAHRLSTVKDYDVIHYIEGGRIVFSGGYEALIQAHETFRRFVNSA